MEKSQANTVPDDIGKNQKVSPITHEPPKGPTIKSNVPAPTEVTFAKNNQNEFDDITPVLDLDNTETPQGTGDDNQTEAPE